MRVTNWGLFLLGVYLILAGLSSIGIFSFLYGLGQITSLIALIAGILLVMEDWRR
jgi:hypothetical protein